jgi:O-antigen/teichoic acid export membrane protein
VGRRSIRRTDGSLRSIAILVVSRGFVAGAGFLASALWAHYFSKDSYGRYQILVAVASVVASFCLTGLDDATLISAAKKKDGNLWPIIKLRLIASTIGAVAIAVWAIVRYWYPDPILAEAMLVSAALFIPAQLASIWQSFTNGKGKFRALTIGQVALSSGNLVAVATFVAAGATSHSMLPWVVLGGQGATATIGILLQFWLRNIKETDDRDPAIIRYGHHVTVASLIGWVFSADRLIVGEVMTPADVAVLSVAIVLPAQVKVFFNAFEQVFLPGVTAAASVADAWVYIKPRMFRLGAAYITLGLIGFFLLPILIPLFFSQRYIDAVPYAKWLWLSTCMASPFVFLASILNAQQDRRFLYTRRLSSQLILLAMFFILIPQFGLLGAIVARIINHAILIVFNTAYFAHVIRARPPSTPPSNVTPPETPSTPSTPTDPPAADPP